ncbi:hypothetical protein S7335_530 [Synechococcus sp. PCC 7335]|nr:hypothetical protein S7335_530 [Synechococcus sp. PCC 7335]
MSASVTIRLSKGLSWKLIEANLWLSSARSTLCSGKKQCLVRLKLSQVV